MTRNYHEKKAVRCLSSIETMTKKLHRLESVRLQRIEDLKKELDEIKLSTVTIVCGKCGKQFVITFTEFTKGNYEKLCDNCKAIENTKYAEMVMKYLKQSNIECSKHYIKHQIIVPLPHRGRWDDK